MKPPSHWYVLACYLCAAALGAAAAIFLLELLS